MEKLLLLPALAVLCTYVVFGAPGVGHDSINWDAAGDGESQCLSSTEESGYCGDGGDDGSEGPVGIPAGMFTVPDGWKPPSDEPCPDPIHVKQNFNITRYLGLWYEIERMWNPFTIGSCGTAQYSLKKDGNVEVFNSERLNQTTNNTIIGTGVPSEGGEGRLTVTFPPSAGGGPPPTGPNYNILLTDYESYTVVYNCDTFQVPQSPQKIKIEYSWILSRTYNLSEYRVEEIKDNLRRFFNIDTERYNRSNLETCKTD